MSKTYTCNLKIHGLSIGVQTDSYKVYELVQHDFSFFIHKNIKPNNLTLIHYSKKDFDIPSLTPINYLSTPRNITFKLQNLTYVDYFGNGSLTYHNQLGPFEIHTKDTDLAREIIFLTILSQVSFLLDKRGYHRVHALGLSYKGNGILLLLPSGGGKTTMALNILKDLKDSNFKLISEDSPLMDLRGNLYNFPLRIGVLPSKLPSFIPKKFTRPLIRMEFSNKMSIDVNYFKKKIAVKPVPLKLILLGERTFENISDISPTNITNAAKAFLSNSIIGIGLYQGLEFLSQSTVSDLFKLSTNISSRTATSLTNVFRTPKYRFLLGNDQDKNLETLRIKLNELFPS